MNITKLFLVDYMEFISNIILPELHLNCDPRWVVDVLQQVLFYIHLHEFKPFQPSVVSYRSQSFALLCKTNDWFPYEMQRQVEMRMYSVFVKRTSLNVYKKLIYIVQDVMNIF